MLTPSPNGETSSRPFEMGNEDIPVGDEPEDSAPKPKTTTFPPERGSPRVGQGALKTSDGLFYRKAAHGHRAGERDRKWHRVAPHVADLTRLPPPMGRVVTWGESRRRSRAYPGTSFGLGTSGSSPEGYPCPWTVTRMRGRR